MIADKAAAGLLTGIGGVDWGLAGFDLVVALTRNRLGETIALSSVVYGAVARRPPTSWGSSCGRLRPRPGGGHGV